MISFCAFVCCFEDTFSLLQWNICWSERGRRASVYKVLAQSINYAKSASYEHAPTLITRGGREPW